jgi:hypothetical protein
MTAAGEQADKGIGVTADDLSLTAQAIEMLFERSGIPLGMARRLILLHNRYTATVAASKMRPPANTGSAVPVQADEGQEG